MAKINRGFTLIEIIIYMSLMSLALTSLILSLYSFFDIEEKLESTLNTEDEGLAMLRIKEKELQTQASFKVGGKNQLSLYKINFQVADHLFSLTTRAP